MKPNRSLWAITAAAACLSAPAFAHHSFAMFDREQTMTLSGTVTEWDWNNPHSWLYLTVSADGNAVDWALEAASLSELARSGWRRTSMKAGDQVTVTVNPRKDGTPGGNLLSVTLADGSVLRRMGPPPAAEQ